MDDMNPRRMALFLELFEALPRQGPGRRDCTARALALCGNLPEAPAILDLGCGVGAQTLHLAEMTSGRIVAVDSNPGCAAGLRAAVAARGLGDRVTVVEGDMGALSLAAASFDLVWSEGALYNLGLDRAFEIARGLLRPGGYLAFTDAVWLSPDPPPAVRALFAEYPGMGDVAAVLSRLERFGFAVQGDFVLPDSAWWDDFYTPMLARLAAMRARYAGDAEALEILEGLAEEPEMHRLNSAHYGYAFFVARRGE